MLESASGQQSSGNAHYPMLEVSGLTVSFRCASGRIRAVDDASLALDKGGSIGVIGESGCGKSTLAKAIVRLVKPEAGKVLIDGEDVFALRGKDLKRMRKKVQMVFQNASQSLDPRMSILQSVEEPIAKHGLAKRGQERRDMAFSIMETAGLSARHFALKPWELSGGERQRACLARALATGPELLICDESVSALDPILRLQILDLLRELRVRLNLSLVFISHDASDVMRVCDRVAVMRSGRLSRAVGLDELDKLVSSDPYAASLLRA